MESTQSRYDFYFASPFFTEEQIEREEALKAILRDKGYTVYSPKEASHLTSNASLSEQEECFDNNLKAIYSSDALFVVTDGKDVGTIWEAGFAYALDIPIVYFCETLPDGAPFNLMLAQSGVRVITSRDELKSTDDLMQSVEYGGAIE